MKRCLIVSSVTFCLFVILQDAEAQVVVDGARLPYSRSAHMEVGLIFAQAELVRAQAEAAVDYQTARSIAADAYDKELDNALKAVDIYFARRARRDAEVLKNHLDEAAERKEKALRRLVDHPELTGEGVVNGRALNTLKEALRSSVLSVAYLNNDVEIAELVSRFQLTPELLSQINLQLTNVRGKTGTFRADTGQLNTFQWWPYLLRDDRFKEERASIEQHLAELRQASSQRAELAPDLLTKLENSVLQLADRFLQTIDGRAMAREGVSEYYLYRESEQHLQTLTHTIQRMKRVGRGDGSLIINGYNPSIDGKDLTSLLAYMVRNGVEFAPPEPGNENAYHQLFEMSKSLYVATAAVDPSP